jgi:hypothetical protein
MRCRLGVLVIASHCGSLLHRLVQRFFARLRCRLLSGRLEVLIGYLQVVHVRCSRLAV